MTEAAVGSLSDLTPRMYRVALRIVGNADGAEDVVQEACVRALRSIDRFEGRAALATWLHRITVNCARTHLGRRRRGYDRRADLDGELAGMLQALEDSPDQHAQRQELLGLAQAAVQMLADDCRCAFVLTQLDGYFYDETAAILGVARGTVASRVYQARKILLDELASQGNGGGRP